MRKLLLLLGLILIFPLAAHAQGAEIFGGYSYMRFDTSPGHTNFNGWNAALTVNSFKVLGFTADFGGDYGKIGGVDSSLHTFLFGPQLRFPARVSPFVHALFGAARFGAGGGSSTSFSTALGGGIDIHSNAFLGIRPIQADWITTNFGSSRQNDFRLSAGLLISF